MRSRSGLCRTATSHLECFAGWILQSARCALLALRSCQLGSRFQTTFVHQVDCRVRAVNHCAQ